MTSPFFKRENLRKEFFEVNHDAKKGENGTRNSVKTELNRIICIILAACMFVYQPLLGVCVAAPALAHAVNAEPISKQGIILGVCGVITGAIAYFIGFEQAVNAIVAWAICSGGLILAGKQRVTSHSLTVFTLCVAFILLLQDSLFAYLAGTDLAASLNLYYMQIQELAAAESVAVLESVTYVVDILRRYWPSIYLLAAIVEVVLIFWGLKIYEQAYKRTSLNFLRLDAYELPWWYLSSVVLGIVLLLVSNYVVWQGFLIQLVAWNLIAMGRIGVALDGLSVMEWYLINHKVKPVFRIPLVLLALVIEVQFMFLTVIGSLDAWANWRHNELAKTN